MDDSLDFEFGYEVLTELPANLLPTYIPNNCDGVGRDGVMVKFSPFGGEKWIGVFAFGDIHTKGESQVIPGPGKNCLTIIAKGEAYIVSPNGPAQFQRVKSCPVFRAIPLPERDLMLFHDYTEVVAYGAKGLVWETDRISWDGIRIIEITNSEVIGQGWDAPNEKHVEFRINLDNGSHQGGAAPPK